MDGVVAVGGCDKNMPGSLMAMARMNVPGIFVYAGIIKPGSGKREAHYREPVRGSGRIHRRQDVAGRLRGHREKRLPVSGRLRRPVHRKHNVTEPRGP